ncbi:MAG: hypothetical protein K9J12_10710 [Melioribacteraceae bacterium]|nr:hypothetical protein [Melioribacteraceae bacterium]MCF8264794.1 hypothetical protein [Melioribacteraceae bacterium]
MTVVLAFGNFNNLILSLGLSLGHDLIPTCADLREFKGVPGFVFVFDFLILILIVIVIIIEYQTAKNAEKTQRAQSFRRA